MQVTEAGSVRVDLAGGTLDLEPIHLIIPNVITLNMALSLKCFITITERAQDIEIESINYQKKYSYKNQDLKILSADPGHFAEMLFIVEMLNFFDAKNLKLTIDSQAPAGSGLGGSSAMGVTLYKCLCSFYDRPFSPLKAVGITRNIEAKILNSGVAGYQDYYPAIYGGLLALKPTFTGVTVEQLYYPEFNTVLRDHLFLVYSGQSRLSGINNWEVYKAFFEKDIQIDQGLRAIANNSYEMYCALKKRHSEDFLKYLKIEGTLRAELFPKILSVEMKNFRNELTKQVKESEIKVCGAGGGGCFLVIFPKQSKEEVKQLIIKHRMTLLDFEIDATLETIES